MRKAAAPECFSEGSGAEKSDQAEGPEHGHAGEESEGEKYWGDFWERKISTFVNRVDLNKDGIISIAEFEWMADRYLSLGQCSEEQSTKLRESLRDIWATYFEEPSRYEPMTASLYCNSLRRFGKQKLVGVVKEFFPYFFDVIDTDDDGKIGVEEYRQFLDIFGMDPADADEAFGHLDTDKDGVLSREEFLEASLEFCCGDDENSPYQFFLGRLID